MKRVIFILLCLTFFSCGRYILKEEKVKGIDSAIQAYYDNDVKSVIKYNMSCDPLLSDTTIIAEDLDWSIKNYSIMPVKVKFNGVIMVDMRAEGLVSFIGQAAKQYGNYYFHMATEPDGRLIIYMVFQNSHNKWLMLAIPVN